MTKRKYDSDADISRKLDMLVVRSEKKAKQAVTQAAKIYEQTLIANTPVHKRQTHTTHAKDVTKISNFKAGETYPVKTVGFNSNQDNGWYIHFPDIGTEVRGTVGQPGQHFIRKTQIMSKPPIMAIYTKAVEDIFDV
ncbi:hypothetical protein JJQ58_00865 [Mammaliicoccus fleurettii]|uniref:Bacteriophage HK97-gp10 tail-component n=1 Tax=Mammaliicoccus fleurettii TaxID=150056 RepID=A0ABS5MJF1_9STAP|nr:HK97-gp10 family putative phage morphogenesis protein [Mammaliicoccus fleurettii]MBL0846529.1 hypothetical protein [Mammaliicoccus fleurettii]MBS3670970.1 hypothetical protein [Mammaliicoccus fleurettii]MBS3696029.1 hypothetical protein [Mammaliicoccus fleurettii]